MKIDSTAALDTHLATFGLAFSISVDINTPSPSALLERLDSAITSHVDSYGLQFTLDPSSLMLASSSSGSSAFLQYQFLPWKLLMGGYYKHGSKNLINIDFKGFEFSHARLAKVAKKIRNANNMGALLFICEYIYKTLSRHH